MTDEVGALDPECAESRLGVVHQRRDDIRPDRGPGPGLATAALVDGDHPETRLGQRRDLAVPSVPIVREAMQEQHRLTIERTRQRGSDFDVAE